MSPKKPASASQEDTEPEDTAEDETSLDGRSLLAQLQQKTLAEMRQWRGKGSNHQFDDVRVSNPGKGRKADYEGSRSHAIHLHCYGCMGGSKKDAANCETQSCPLWPFRPNAAATMRNPGQVPTLLQYSALMDCKTSEAQVAARALNAERLRKKD